MCVYFISRIKLFFFFFFCVFVWMNVFIILVCMYVCVCTCLCAYLFLSIDDLTDWFMHCFRISDCVLLLPWNSLDETIFIHFCLYVYDTFCFIHIRYSLDEGAQIKDCKRVLFAGWIIKQGSSYISWFLLPSFL